MVVLILVGVLLMCAAFAVAFIVEGAEGKNASQLLAMRAERIKAAGAIDDKAKAEGRELTEQEESDVDRLLAEADEIKILADKVQQGEDRSARLASAKADMSKPLPRPSMRGQQTPPASDGLMPPDRAVSSNQHDRINDDPKRGYATLGHFAQSVEHLYTPGHAADERIKMLAAASGMSQGVGAEGGVLVPPEFSTQMWDGMSRDPDNIATLCDNYTVEGESLTFPRERETSRADSYRDGGVLAYWLQEAQQITSTKVGNLAQMKIEPHELDVLIYATNKLLRNSALALTQYLQRKGQRAITFKLNDAIINGDGVGKPLGILNSDALVSVTKETGQVAGTVVYGNVRKMRARMHPNFAGQWLWLVNQEVPQHLEQMVMTVGTAGVAVYMPASGISQDGYDRLYGRQVRVIEYCQAPGTVGDIIAWAPKSYCIGTRGSPETSFSVHLRYDYNETAFRFVFEADGQPWIDSAVTPYKGTDTLSTMVTVAAR